MTQSVESFDHQRCHHQGCHVGFYRSRGDEGVVFECSQRLDIENSLLAYMSRLPRNKDSGSQEDVFSLEKQANSGYRNIRGNNGIYWNWFSSVGNSPAVEGMVGVTITVLSSRSLYST